eukprot:CAMPEP_0201480378 /NCGR_PEP_ID=MMETSP0151_2-20130828/4865_1 /ASSEMBLY_ACC=CAM_ASM_000257 /TAXON_ID=200890 /ORGANISM="Paramoeba atlantica, Strain 621/1 / CCAP 1560/9" /LENGTH=62 /DNA_ID=CAMNT_0047862203 /DNA_START=304 /DNA_END=489 /DNA_ORIENTATION=+
MGGGLYDKDHITRNLVRHLVPLHLKHQAVSLRKPGLDLEFQFLGNFRHTCSLTCGALLLYPT